MSGDRRPLVRRKEKQNGADQFLLSLPARDPREELRKRLEKRPWSTQRLCSTPMSCCSSYTTTASFSSCADALGASDKLVETAVERRESEEVDSRHAQRDHSWQDAGRHQSRRP